VAAFSLALFMLINREQFSPAAVSHQARARQASIQGPVRLVKRVAASGSTRGQDEIPSGSSAASAETDSPTVSSGGQTWTNCGVCSRMDTKRLKAKTTRPNDPLAMSRAQPAARLAVSRCQLLSGASRSELGLRRMIEFHFGESRPTTVIPIAPILGRRPFWGAHAQRVPGDGR